MVKLQLRLRAGWVEKLDCRLEAGVMAAMMVNRRRDYRHFDL